jgi:hypothetical protein
MAILCNPKRISGDSPFNHNMDNHLNNKSLANQASLLDSQRLALGRQWEWVIHRLKQLLL